jgi:hypothetical protein
MDIARVSMLLFLLCGCSKSAPAEPGKFEEFLTKIGPGGIKPPSNCSPENDGKRYSLEGYLHVGRDMTLDGGKTLIEFFQKNAADGAGEGDSFSVRVSLGNWLSKGDIDDLWGSATQVKSEVYGVQKGVIAEDALRVHLADGSVAGHKEKLRLTVEVDVLPQINPSTAASCEYLFESASKL